MSDTDIAVAEEEQTLVEAVTAFRGNPHSFLVALLKAPDATATSICADMGTAIATYYQWRSSLPNFRNTVERIQSSSDSLRNSYVQALFDDMAPTIGEAMVSRATSTLHKDGQRAAERILEQVGALAKPGIDISQVDSVDMIAIRLRMKQTTPTPAIEAEFRDVPIADDGPSPASDHSVTGPSADDKGHDGAE